MVAQGIDGGKITGGEAKSTLEDPAAKGAPETGIADGALADERLGTQGAALAATTVDEIPASDEATPEANPRLSVYAAHYDRWDKALKTKYPWKEVRARLLTDTIEGGGEPLLTAAEGLVEAVFFGMDAEGNPLFADGKEDPRDLPFCGLGYEETRQLVRFKKNDRGEQVPTGYTMFPYANRYDKSEEIRALELFTEKPFVQSRKEGPNEYVSSWLESGENAPRPRYIGFSILYKDALISSAVPDGIPLVRGVRRLLRGQRA